jgi:diguanylate cyclase (GGDEF)-like protein/PAS domain S-box-containing protein
MERYLKLYEAACDGLFLLDMEGYIREVNQAGCQRLGYEKHELLGRHISELNSPEFASQCADRVQMLLREGMARFRSAHVAKDGRLMPVEVNVRRIELDGQTYFFSIARDITEQVAVERESRECEALYHGVVETSTDGFLMSDVAGNLLYANEAYTQLSGYSRQELLALNIADLTADLSSEEMAQRLEALTVNGGVRVERKHRRKDGSIWHAEVSATYSPLNGGRLLGFFRDITARKAMEGRMRLAASVYEVSIEGITITDTAGRIIDVNDACCQISGYPRNELIGKTPAIFRSGHHPDAFYRLMWESLASQGSWNGEIWNRRKSGEMYPAWLTISCIRDEQGSVVNYVALLTDITRRKEAEERAQYLAFYDPLTSLPNRRLLIDRLGQAMASSERQQSHGAVLFIDLDNFKRLNDTKGHNAGDQLLVEVATRLGRVIRDEDTVARLGGDEFVVMLEGLSEDIDQAVGEVDLIAEKLRVAIALPFVLGDFRYQVTTSIGAALFRGNEESINDLLKRADAAMYQSKSAGRNAFRFFDAELQQALDRRIELEAELRHALDDHQFRLFYQVQADREGSILGAEGLVRWSHPQHGLLLPSEFIGVCEETGLILELGRWVLETACHQLKEWAAQAETAGLTLSVNVSAVQFYQANFVDMVVDVLQRTGANPQLLKLEITESVLLEKIEESILKMDALRKLGIRFSLDDFGTGYSSLIYLKRLPLYQLKIDQGFINDIATNHNDEVIAQTIIGMAHSLGLEAIAEGVETEEQRGLLLKSECREFQGYLLGRPVPIEEFMRSLRKGK